MNSRPRNGPWRGYRSNAGVAFASPDRSRRIEHNNNYDGRGSYRRAGGRSRTMQPPTRTNVFVEAGRLAAEYLVSRGVLPPNAMQGNWRDGEVDNRDVLAPSLSRSASLDAESSNDKELGKGWRRSESLNIDRSGVNCESGKSGTWIKGTSINEDIEGSAVRHDENDGIGGLQNSSPVETTDCVGGNVLESEVQKCNSVEDGSTNARSFNNGKSLTLDPSVTPVVEFDVTTRPTEVSMEVKTERNENDLQEVNDKNKITDHEREDPYESTDSRSSLMTKSSVNVPDDMKEDGLISEREKSEVSGVHAMDVSADPLSYENQKFRKSDSDVIDDSVIVDKPNGTYMTKVVQRSGSLSGRSVCEDEKPDADGLIGFDGLSSLVTNKSSKRTLDSDDESRDSFKRLKEWFPTIGTHVDSSQRNQLTQQEYLTSQSDHATLSDDQKGMNVLLSPKGHTNSSEILEEKQLLSGSFQSWDLNLLGTSDGNENHDVANPVLVFPRYTGPEIGKAVVPIESDLTMSTNRKLSNNKGKHGIYDNDIEIIDLEDESAQEDKSLDDSKGRGDTVSVDLDCFHRNTANEMPIVQGGYGLMMSELFENGIPNSSMSANVNSLHNNTSLPNEEGILGDDDSIYMSLGEIPSSHLGPWGHPNQNYRKPF